MRSLSGLKPEDIVFIDIETVRRCENLIEGSRDYEAWKRKLGRRLEKQDIDIIDDYHSRAAFFPEFSRIACISVGRIVGKKIVVRTYQYEDEHKILDYFNTDLENVFRKNPNTILCGHSIKKFDVPFLMKRSISKGIIPSTLIDVGGLKAWDVKMIDTIELWKGTGFYNCSLDSMCLSLDIDSSKDEISGSEVGDLYYVDGGIEKIVNYCEKDVVAVINCFRKMNFQDVLTIIDHQEVKEPEPETLFQRIANTGVINEEDEIEIIKEASLLNHKEKQLFIDMIKASLSRLGQELTEEIELEILKS